MRIEVKVALIGAAAAIVAALIPIAWSWFDSEPEFQSAEMTLTVSQDASPYLAYDLSETPPAFANAKAKTDQGFYLWPEADLTELLPILSLGVQDAPRQYPTYSDVSEPGNLEREDHTKQIWMVIEEVGRVAKARPNDIPSDLRTKDGSALITLDADDALVGLQILRAVYLGDDTRVADATNPVVQAILGYTAKLFKDGAADSTDSRQWLAAKYLAQRRVYPILDLTITNPNDDPMVITGLMVDVLAVAPAMSGLQTTALDVVDIVRVKLDPAGGPHPVALTAPLRIAAKDTARIRLEISSDALFGFLARVDVVRGADVLGSIPAIIVDIGFRPPAGSKPI